MGKCLLGAIHMGRNNRKKRPSKQAQPHLRNGQAPTASTPDSATASQAGSSAETTVDQPTSAEQPGSPSEKQSAPKRLGSQHPDFLKNQGRLKRLTPEERHDFASKGGKAAAAMNRRNRDVREVLNLLLSSPLNDDNRSLMEEEFPSLSLDELGRMATMLTGQIKASEQGNPVAFKQLIELTETSSAAVKDDPVTANLRKLGKQAFSDDQLSCGEEDE